MMRSSTLQRTAEIVMVLGIVALCQPWSLFLHRYGVTIVIVGLTVSISGIVMMSRIRTALFTRNPYMLADTTWGFTYVAHGVMGVALVGLVIDHGSDANFVPVNTAENWLHLILGVAMIGLGLGLTRGTRAGRS